MRNIVIPRRGQKFQVLILRTKYKDMIIFESNFRKPSRSSPVFVRKLE